MGNIEIQLTAAKQGLAVFIECYLYLLRLAVQAAGQFAPEQATRSHGMRTPLGIGLAFLVREELRVYRLGREFAESVAEVVHQMRW